MSDDTTHRGRRAPTRRALLAALATAIALFTIAVAAVAPAGAQDDDPSSTFPGTSDSPFADDHMDDNGLCDPGYIRDYTTLGETTCIPMSEHLNDLGIDPAAEAAADDDPGWLVALQSMRLVGFVLLGLGLLARKLRNS